MNYTLADIQILSKDIERLDPAYRELVVKLIQDWLEMARNPINVVKEGLKLSETFRSGDRIVAEFETLDEVLKLPLCDDCRRMIKEIVD